MLKELKGAIKPIEVALDTVNKNIIELETRAQELRDKKHEVLSQTLNTISDEDCEVLEDLVFQLFKVYHQEDKGLRRLPKSKFRILSSSMDDNFIRFAIQVTGWEAEFEVCEHYAVFKDFKKYLSLREEVVATTIARQKARIANDAANHAIEEYMSTLESLV